MTSAFENLTGANKPLRVEPPDQQDEGDLNVDERIVTDLLVACQAVAVRVDALSPLP